MRRERKHSWPSVWQATITDFRQSDLLDSNKINVLVRFKKIDGGTFDYEFNIRIGSRSSAVEEFQDLISRIQDILRDMNRLSAILKAMEEFEGIFIEDDNIIFPEDSAIKLGLKIGVPILK